MDETISNTIQRGISDEAALLSKEDMLTPVLDAVAVSDSVESRDDRASATCAFV